jgi:hypothetical protein
MCHDKDVLYVEVKHDIPQDMGLHFVARRALHDKEWPKGLFQQPKKIEKP